eukprot:6205638-Lingulodinium_polyedra.AAC.1
MSEPLRRRAVDSTASLWFVGKALRNDVVETTIHSRSGWRITRWRVPYARQKSGARMEHANV